MHIPNQNVFNTDYLSYLFAEQDVYNLAETLLQTNRDKRVITDIAISKIPYIAYPELTNVQSLVIHELAEHLLNLSQKFNDSNEVSITCDIKNIVSLDKGLDFVLRETGISYGTNNETDFFSDTLSMSIVNRANSITVVSLHNHPSCSTFSVQDISLLLKLTAIKLMVVVGNNGELYYLSKNRDYNHDRARAYLTNAALLINPNAKSTPLTVNEMLQVSNLFLKNCKTFGMEYQHVLQNNKELQVQLDTIEEKEEDLYEK